MKALAKPGGRTLIPWEPTRPSRLYPEACSRQVACDLFQAHFTSPSTTPSRFTVIRVHLSVPFVNTHSSF